MLCSRRSGCSCQHVSNDGAEVLHGLVDSVIGWICRVDIFGAGADHSVKVLRYPYCGRAREAVAEAWSFACGREVGETWADGFAEVEYGGDDGTCCWRVLCLALKQLYRHIGLNEEGVQEGNQHKEERH